MTGVRMATGESERRVCRVLGQARSTQRYSPRRRDGEARLVKRIHELVRAHPRRGYRMIHGMLRLEGWRVNAKRVERLWRLEGLKVPRKQRKKRRLGSSDQGIVRRRATQANEVWSIDFIHDRDDRGRALKWLSVVDEKTRECLSLEVGRSLTSAAVAEILMGLFASRTVPKHIRSDNGPEFIASTIRRLALAVGRGVAEASLHHGPRKPHAKDGENGVVESFHARLRDELLNAEIFLDLEDARSLSRRWRDEYNHHRPHSSLGYVPPAAYAASLGVPPVGLRPSLRPAQRWNPSPNP